MVGVGVGGERVQRGAGGRDPRFEATLYDSKPALPDFLWQIDSWFNFKTCIGGLLNASCVIIGEQKDCFFSQSG